MSKLRVWWIPQIPGVPFHVDVSSTEQAIFLLNTLADYDLFQLHHNIKPDYCNTGGLEVFEDGEWLEWGDEDGQDINDLIRAAAESDDEAEDYNCIHCQDTGEGIAPDSRCDHCPKKGRNRDEP